MMTVTQAELEPCPFCGAGIAKTTAWGTGFSGVEILDTIDQPFAMCGTCGARTRTCDSTAEAIGAWNTRTSSTRELVEALEPFVKKFEERRKIYARRYGARADVGRANFDAMPDDWPMDETTFTIGDYRRAARALTNLGGHP